MIYQFYGKRALRSYASYQIQVEIISFKIFQGDIGSEFNIFGLVVCIPSVLVIYK